MLNHLLGSATVRESSVLVTDGGVETVSVLLKLYEFCCGVETSSRPISRSRVLLNSLETSYVDGSIHYNIILKLDFKKGTNLK